MKPQDQATRARRRQWIVAAAAAVGIALFTFILFKPEPIAPVPTTVAASAPAAPKLTAAALRPGEPAAPAGEAPANAQLTCQACEEKNRGGTCLPNMGCEGLAEGDKTLCENLLSCLRAHPECRTKNPNLCYCGSAQGIACVTAPKGECLEEALAAAKTTNPTEGGIRFFRPDFPSGRASQVVVCDIKACREPCAQL